MEAVTTLHLFHGERTGPGSDTAVDTLADTLYRPFTGGAENGIPVVHGGTATYGGGLSPTVRFRSWFTHRISLNPKLGCCHSDSKYRVFVIHLLPIEYVWLSNPSWRVTRNPGWRGKQLRGRCQAMVG